MMPPRTANSPRPSTRSVRRYPNWLSAQMRPSNSTSAPDSSRIGWTGVGLSRWVTARTEATTIDRSPPSRALRATIRSAMVPMLGETCSNGSVSHAGRCLPIVAKSVRSSASSSASRSPGTTPRTLRPVRSEIPASTTARSAGGTTKRPGIAGTRSRPKRVRTEASGAATGSHRTDRPRQPVWRVMYPCSASHRTVRSSVTWSGV